MDKQTIEALISALNSNKEIVRRDALQRIKEVASFPEESLILLTATCRDPDLQAHLYATWRPVYEHC